MSSFTSYQEIGRSQQTGGGQGQNGAPGNDGGSVAATDGNVSEELARSGVVPTWASPVQGTWERVTLPFPVDGPMSSYTLLVEDDVTGWRFVPTDPVPGVPGPEPDLQALFDDVRARAFARVLWPRIAIQANPGRLGLAGLPTHYWVTGYGGEPLAGRDTAEVPADVGPDVPTAPDPRNPARAWYPADGPRRRDRRLEVDVWVAPARFAWAWGDGTPGVSGRTLGRPAPARSAPGERRGAHLPVRLPGPPGGFPVSLDVTFGVSYTVRFDGASETVDLGAIDAALRARLPRPGGAGRPRGPLPAASRPLRGALAEGAAEGRRGRRRLSAQRWGPRRGCRGCRGRSPLHKRK